MLGDLDFRNNGIGFLRFFFAAVVIWSHGSTMGGYASVEPLARLIHGAATAGFLAVGGFFVLSGFLITRSYEYVGAPGRFVWHRFLRIFPGFWICLAVTAFLLVPPSSSVSTQRCADTSTDPIRPGRMSEGTSSFR